MFEQLHDVISKERLDERPGKDSELNVWKPEGHVPAQDVELLGHVPDVLAVALVHLLQQMRRLHTQGVRVHF